MIWRYSSRPLTIASFNVNVATKRGHLVHVAPGPKQPLSRELDSQRRIPYRQKSSVSAEGPSIQWGVVLQSKGKRASLSALTGVPRVPPRAKEVANVRDAVVGLSSITIGSDLFMAQLGGSSCILETRKVKDLEGVPK